MTYFLMLIIVLLVSAVFELTVIPAILIAFFAGMVGAVIEESSRPWWIKNTEQEAGA